MTLEKDFVKLIYRNNYAIIFTEKGLVYFQSIRANWNKKFSVIATEKPSLPPNRVFSGPTFDFR